MAFSIKARLGRGRTIETFAATLEVGREALEVVVKRPRPELATNEAFVSAFVRWGQEEKDVEHDDIVAVLEAGRTPDGAYVIQERVQGASLAQLLLILKKKKRSMGFAQALAIAERVASALAALHARGVAHGGVDPNEVLVGYDGSVKLGDQRLHTLDAHAGADLAPASDETAIHRAPELASATSAPTPASDVYSLALIVLEMLIGQPVWRSQSMTVGGTILALKDFTHVGQAQPAVTEELVDILYSSTLDKPEERVPSGKELRAGLARVIQKYGLTTDRKTLGAFVEAAVPPPRQEEAPTMLLDPAKAEELARRHAAALSEIEGASVAIDPDIERKALSRVAPPAAPIRKTSMPAVAPSVARAKAAEVRVHSTTPRAEAAVKNRTLLRAGVGVIVLILAMMGLHMATRTGANVRIVQVSASSTPAGAELFLDDEPAGKTPVETSVAAKGGRLTLRFVLDGFETHEVSIDTKADELRYDARLKPAAAP